MPNTPADRLRPHLSALVDGELAPLEAIAIQRHMRQCPELLAEQRDLERLKLGVHLAGTRDPAPAEVGARLRAAVEREVAAAQARRRRLRWVAPLAVAAAALAIALPFGLSDPAPERGLAASTVAVAPAPSEAAAWSEPYALGADTLERLVALHLGQVGPEHLRDLAEGGVLTGIESLPSGFILPHQSGARATLVPASTMRCHEEDGGPTLVELRADRVDLASDIALAVAAQGFYATTVGDVEVRLSVRGSRILVLLHAGPDDRTPI